MTQSHVATLRLILIPSVLTLAVTLLRLAGELEGWSTTFFNPEPGGWLSIVGIVWLVPIFGVYFALKLAGAGERPAARGRAIALSVVGLALFVSGFVLFNFVLGYRVRWLMLMWALAALGAAVQFFAWPALARVLLHYGYAARIPIAIIMYIATQNEWHSHYSAMTLSEFQMSSTRQYVLFGLFPQLVWWVAFTVTIGGVFGTVAVALARRGKAADSISVSQ
jgi:hypothetical protein